MDIQTEKETLIDMFRIHFETMYHLSPLGSRLLAILILDGGEDGITFEELVKRLDASKSSVSTNLNFLLKIGKINYATLPGNRKKYFKAAPFSERISNYQKMVENEKKIIEMMLSYRERTASGNAERIDLENIKAYKTHVLEVEELLLKTINRFKEIENK